MVVDDSALQRQILVQLIGADPELHIVGSPANGLEALQALERLQPDVITLDNRMPLMCGLETARRIMRDAPTPIVMISGASESADHDVREAAMSAGVLAFCNKQSLLAGGEDAAAELRRLIKGMASVRLVRRRREPSDGVALLGQAPSPILLPTTPEVVAIGASTGGPQALREIISQLPASFSAPVLVVQHTTAGYSDNLVDWLRAGARLPVQVAEHGQPLDRRGVYIAPTQRHLLVRGRYLALEDSAPVSLHRPSATVLFQSVAASFGRRAIGILLTGMGDDGAVGLADMRRAGALTIAQDESTSVVFGMPAEAIRLGAVDHVLPLGGIPQLLLDELGASRRSAA